MRSWAVVSFLVVALAGVGVLLVTAAGDERDQAFTLGVAPGLPTPELPPGAEACQTPVAVAEPFDGVRVQVGTYKRPGAPLAVTVRTPDGDRVLAAGRVAGGYPDVSQLTASLDATVAAGQRVAVCVRNLGRRKLALYGGPELAAPGSTVEVDGRDRRTDLMLVFTRKPRSLLSQVPEVFERASLFRPVWIGPWAYWLLVTFLVLVVPALLARALAAIEKNDLPREP